MASDQPIDQPALGAAPRSLLSLLESRLHPRWLGRAIAVTAAVEVGSLFAVSTGIAPGPNTAMASMAVAAILAPISLPARPFPAAPSVLDRVLPPPRSGIGSL